MNIWFITNEYPPFFGGGIATYTKSAADMFAKNGHAVTVFVQSEPYPDKKTANLTIVRFTKPDPQRLEQSSYKYLSFIPALSLQYANVILHYLQNSKEIPDIIESSDCLGLAYYLLLRKKNGEPLLQKTKIVINCHTPAFVVKQQNHDNEFFKYSYWMGLFEKECIRLADGVICPSEYLQKHLAPIFPDKPITVLNLPLPPIANIRINTRKIKKHCNKPIDILFVGRLEYRKAAWQFLEACKKLWITSNRFHVAILGGDQLYYPYRKSMVEILRSEFGYFIDQGYITLIDKVPQETVYAFMQTARIVTVPSLFENFPYVCVEAMLLKKPVLASLQGGQAEMVGTDNTAGFVFDWKKPGDLEQKILSMLSLSKKELLAMGEKAYTRIQSISNHADNILKRIDYFSQLSKQRTTSKTYPTSVSPATGCTDIEPEPKYSIIIPIDSHTGLETTLNSLNLIQPAPSLIVFITETPVNPPVQALIDNYAKLHTIPSKQICFSSSYQKALVQAMETIKTEAIIYLPAKHTLHPDFPLTGLKTFAHNNNCAFVYTWLQLFGHAAGIKPTFNLDPVWLFISTLLPDVWMCRRSYILPILKNLNFTQSAELLHILALETVLSGYSGLAIPDVLTNICLEKNKKEISTTSIFKKHILTTHQDYLEKATPALLQIIQENRA